jgi:hypothetical protein
MDVETTLRVKPRCHTLSFSLPSVSRKKSQPCLMVAGCPLMVA